MRTLKGKRVLVIGGAGFIGSHLTDRLLAEDTDTVTVLDNFFLGKEENLIEAKKSEKFRLYRDDARQYGVVRSVIQKEQIQVVFNLATIALNYSFFNPVDAYMVNVQIVENLLKLLQDRQYETLIQTSSSEAYGSAKYTPMDEYHPMDPTTPYAAGKAAADLMALSFYKVLDLDIMLLRPFNNYGPRQNFEGPLAGIIPNCVTRILKGRQPYIEGSGEQQRDFIYVEDTVQAFLALYSHEECRGEVFNVGSGSHITMNGLVETICREMKYTGGIERRPERTSDVKDLLADSSKAEKLLGFRPVHSFEEGIRKTIDWYREVKK